MLTVQLRALNTTEVFIFENYLVSFILIVEYIVFNLDYLKAKKKIS